MPGTQYASKANAVDVALNLCRLASKELDEVIDGCRDLTSKQNGTSGCEGDVFNIEIETIPNLECSYESIQDALRQIAAVKDAFDSGKSWSCGGSSWTGF